MHTLTVLATNLLGRSSGGCGRCDWLVVSASDELHVAFQHALRRIWANEAR